MDLTACHAQKMRMVAHQLAQYTVTKTQDKLFVPEGSIMPMDVHCKIGARIHISTQRQVSTAPAIVMRHLVTMMLGSNGAIKELT